MLYGRHRAAARIDAGRYELHAGLENFLPPGRLRDQATTLRVVEALVAAQPWRADRREAWLAILRQLVYRMDWKKYPGLVYAVTAADLGAAGDRAARTVSRVVAWAVEAGLIVVAEKAASASFLGSRKGRTPAYAFYAPPGLPQPPNTHEETPAPITPTELVNTFDTLLGDLPTPCLPNKPLNGRRLKPAHPDPAPWPVFAIPLSPSDRTRATHCLLHRLGLDSGGVSGVPLWRTRAQLKCWWDAGASPAGLIWAIDHHPDRIDHHRGQAFRGARDPLRVLGHRLKPWKGRLGELPVAVRGIPGDYTAARPQDHPVGSSPNDSPRSRSAAPITPTSSATHRARLRAEFAERRAQRRKAGRPR